jgi:DNA-binding CsgD family transcriptional regulator
MADFSPTGTDEAQLHLMRTLCGWIGADNARWHAGVRLMTGTAAREDSMNGWRLCGTRALLPRSPERVKAGQRFHRVQKGLEVGLPVRAISVEAGVKFRVHTMRDGFIDFAAFRKTDYYRAFYRDFNISDRMWINFPISRDTESILVLDRHKPARSFTRRHVAIAASAFRGLKWFHRQLLLSHGLHGVQASLSPGRRLLVQQLLTGKSEKEIAIVLGLSAATTHQYVTEIFRHFGVNNRASLQALWLGPA